MTWLRTLHPAPFNLKVGYRVINTACFEQCLLNFDIERDAALEELKLYGRDPSYADPIFTKEVCRLARCFLFSLSHVP